MPQSNPGSTPGIDPRSQGVIPERFKRKKIFVTDERTKDEGWTHRCDGRNSSLDVWTGPTNGPVRSIPRKNDRNSTTGE